MDDLLLYIIVALIVFPLGCFSITILVLIWFEPVPKLAVGVTGTYLGIAIVAFAAQDAESIWTWIVASPLCSVILYFVLQGLNIALHPELNKNQESNPNEEQQNKSTKQEEPFVSGIESIEEKFNITYDYEFMQQIDKYKNSIHKYGRRYEAYKRAIRRFEEGDYGITRPENEITLHSGQGVIIAIYTCWDCCVEIDSFWWYENGESKVGTIVRCIECHKTY